MKIPKWLVKESERERERERERVKKTLAWQFDIENNTQ